MEKLNHLRNDYDHEEIKLIMKVYLYFYEEHIRSCRIYP